LGIDKRFECNEAFNLRWFWIRLGCSRVYCCYCKRLGIEKALQNVFFLLV